MRYRGAVSEQGDETKQRVMDAAIAVFSKGGWAGFTIHAVAKKSRVSLGSLYHHFGSIDGIAAAAWSRSLTRLLEALAKACANKRSARASVEALVLGYLDFTERHRAEALFIHASSWASFMPEHAERLGVEKRRAFMPLLVRFGGYVEAGELVSASPAMLEMLLIGPAAETARRWLSDERAVDLAEARRCLPAATWRAVRLDS